MPIKKSFRRTIFIYFFTVFIFFTLVILLFQYNREKKYKTDQLENTLANATELSHNFIEHYRLFQRNSLKAADTLKFLLPEKNIRITIIDKKGTVLYDSFVSDVSNVENHLIRFEIQKALYSEYGTNICFSETIKKEFYYYARFYDGYFIRAAMIYNIEIENFLKAEHLFIFFLIAVFMLVGLIIYVLTNRLSVSITKLKDFAVIAGKNEPIRNHDDFPNNELGEIGSQIVKIYGNLKKAKDDLSNEHERLFNHLNILNEGIAFFSKKKEKMLANSHFIQFVSIISNTLTITAENIFSIPEFQKMNHFLDENLERDVIFQNNELPQTEYTIYKSERYFKIQCIIFADKSFEILITDISRPEKRRLLKQQITSNIAHELKTPLASIKGYLETILNNKAIEKEKQLYFIQKAFDHAERLNLLLNDISLLNNIEDAGDLFEFKKINLARIIHDVKENLESRLISKNIKMKLNLDNNIVINGNDSLIWSVFQNLIENTINYGGENIEIEIKNYLEDKKFHYFSYSDTGVGIPEEHFHRIFERFYRIDSGRTREQGGTGLGLSIVKNAIVLHKGEISVRNRLGGGIEFLFSLAKG